MLVNEDSADQFTKKSLDGGVEGNIKMRLFPSTNIHIFFCTSNITLHICVFYFILYKICKCLECNKTLDFQCSLFDKKTNNIKL